MRTHLTFFCCPPTNLLVLLACLLLAHSSEAQRKESAAAPELTAVLATGLRYPVNQWVPVRCEIYNRGDKQIDGQLVLAARGGVAPVSIRTSVSCPPNSRTRVITFAYFVPEPFEDAPQSQSSPIATVELRSSQGALLTQTPLLGQVASIADKEAGGGLSTLLIAIRPDDTSGSDPDDAAMFAEYLSNISGVSVLPVEINRMHFPQESVALDAARFILARLDVLQSLDIAQRNALLERVIRGGVLIIPSSGNDPAPESTWLAPHFPVSYVGKRLASQVPGIDSQSRQLKFVRPTWIVDAIGTRGQAVLRNEHFVYAAFNPVGMGRLASIGFPVSPIDVKDAASSKTMAELLGLQTQEPTWANSELPQRRDEILQGMIGRPTTSWRAALAIVTIYLGVIGALYAFLRGPTRPYALAGSLILALLLALGLIGVTFVQTRAEGDRLVSATIGTIDVAGNNILRQEAVAFLGTDQPLSLKTDGDASLRPVAARGGDTPLISVHPFAAPDAIVRRTQIETIWQANSVAQLPDALITCTGRFRSDGLVLSIRNALKAPLRSPLLIWGDARYELADVPAGTSEIGRGQMKGVGDFSSASAGTEVAKLRANFLRAVSTPRRPGQAVSSGSASPMLVGWLDQYQPSLIQSDATVSSNHSHLLVRTNVSIEPSTAGAAVRVNDGLTQFHFGDAVGLPYDVKKAQWISTGQTGEWLIAISAPGAAGKIKPTRLKFTTDVVAASHRVRLRKGQCRDGSAQQDISQPIVAEWNGQSGRKAVEIQCAPSDYDSRGRIWLLLTAEALDVAPNDASAALWQVRESTAEMDGVAF